MKKRIVNRMNGAFCATLLVGMMFIVGCEAPSGMQNMPATCTDSVQNGGESAVDCGGPCKGCGLGKTCNTAADCDSKQCVGGVCVQPPDGGIVSQDLTPPASPDLNSCLMGETACNNACKNTQTDAFHCGGCGQACFQGQTCVVGVCVGMMGADAGPLVCPPGHGDCDGDGKNCETDLNASDSNCGACGMPCDVANGQICSQGACKVPPKPDLTTQPDLIIPADLLTNPDLATSADLTLNQGADSGMVAADLAKPAEDLTMNPDQTPAPKCPLGEKVCGGNCVDPMSDGLNCGGCNNSCQKNGQFCSNGVCVNSCAQGEKLCGLAMCVDHLTDNSHCGGCNKACPFNKVCRNGICILDSCPQSRRDCNNDPKDGCEIDAANDINHCGGCGQVCTIDHGSPACWNGICSVWWCFGAFRDCNNNPVDGCEIDSSKNLTHCGWCGNTCPAVLNGTRGCSAGICGIGACSQGFADCNASAKDGCETNLTNDSLSCGGCNKACKLSNATPSCTAGACVIKKCDFGWDDCNGVAVDGCEVDVRISISNCGACNKQCTQGVCQFGQCVVICSPGNTLCGNACVNTNVDPAHCGGCNKPCGQGQTCSSGVCQPVNQSFNVKIEASAMASSEVHIYCENSGSGNDHYGLTTFVKNLNQIEACTWGIELAARVDKAINMAMPWYGCDQGAPSLNTITVKINGVVTAGTFVKHPWTCNGGGEGNIYFSPKQLGCP